MILLCWAQYYVHYGIMYTDRLVSLERKCQIVLIEKTFWHYHDRFLERSSQQYPCSSACWSQNIVNTTVQGPSCFHLHQCVLTRAAWLWISLERTSILSKKITYSSLKSKLCCSAPIGSLRRKNLKYIRMCIHMNGSGEVKSNHNYSNFSKCGGIVIWFTEFYSLYSLSNKMLHYS